MKRRFGIGSKISPYMYLLPALAMLVIFVYLPLIQSIQYSFYNFKSFKPFHFVGLFNYSKMFADSNFLHSIFLTIEWALMSAIIPGFCGLVLAILLEFRTKSMFFTGLSRTILIMPMMMSMVAVGVLWSLIYNPLFGLINGFLELLKVTSNANPLDLLSNEKTALLAAFLTTVWQGSGFSMVIFSAALQGLPRDVVEASYIDGASKFQQIRKVSVPMIITTITTVFTVNMISGFKAFDILQVLTGGGPSNATTITSLYMYRQAFFAFKWDYSSAIAVILFLAVIIFVLAVGFFTDRVNKRYV